MQYELRTLVIEPRRKTFTNLSQRYGDRPASRYEEGSVDIQPTENFHYRPLWAPEREIYDAGWSALKLADPDGYTDPRQYYYAPYVAARAKFHEEAAASLDYLDKHGLLARLPQAWSTLLTGLVIPLRHYESGAQMISNYGCRFAYGSTIEQPLGYAAFDRVGNAQLLSRIGLTLGGGTDELLTDARAAWTGSPALQPLRRLTEELLTEQDWAIALTGLDLADRLLYPFLFRHLDEAATASGALGYSLLARHFADWFADQRRWIDALLTAWTADPDHGPANAAALASAADDMLPRAEAAATALGTAADELVDAGCAAAVASTAQTVRETIARLTGSVPGPAAGKEA